MQPATVAPGVLYNYSPLFNSMLLMLLGIGMKWLSRRNNSAEPLINEVYFAPSMLIGTLAVTSTYVTRAIGNSLLPAATGLASFELMVFVILVLVGALDRFSGWDYGENANDPPVRNATALVVLNGVSVAAFVASFFLAVRFRVIC